MPVADEEGYQPRGDTDLSALVGEDEEGAEDGCLVASGELEGLHPRWRVGLLARGGLLERGHELCRGNIGLVGAVGKACGGDVGKGEEEGDAVEVTPPHAIRGEGRGNKRADGTAYAVGAVEETEGGSGV